jgi:hypothetical protein
MIIPRKKLPCHRNRIYPALIRVCEFVQQPNGSQDSDQTWPSFSFFFEKTTTDLIEEVAQAELTSLVNGILQPIVSRYLTPDKTTKLVDKSVRNKPAVLRWVVSQVPTKFSNYFVREKIAPSFVKGFASWAAKTIMKFSSDHIFEVLQRHSIEFLAAINKANAHAAPHPT